MKNAVLFCDIPKLVYLYIRLEFSVSELAFTHLMLPSVKTILILFSSISCFNLSDLGISFVLLESA